MNSNRSHSNISIFRPRLAMDLFMLVFSPVLLSHPEHEGTEVQERGVHMYRLAKHLSKAEILRACFAPLLQNPEPWPWSGSC